MLRRYLCVPLFAMWAGTTWAQPTLLDPSFGTNGYVLIGLSGFGGDRAEDVAVLSDGRIVVVGARGGVEEEMAALRLLENGDLDNSFSGNGWASISVGVNAEARAMLVQPDGKVVLAGSAEFPGDFDDLAFVRLMPNGTLDTSFSGDGRFTISGDGASDVVLALALRPDGHIIGAGKFDGTVADMMAVRLTPEGTLDATFADNGIFDTGLHTGELAEDMVLRADGRVVLAGGWRLTLPDADMAMLQLSDAGEPDPTFGTDGLFRPSEGGSTSSVVAAVELPDGQVLIAGRRYVPGGNPEQVFTGRVTENGAWDPTYGTDGRAFLNLGPGYTGAVRDMVVLQDGKALVTVDVLNGSEASIMVFRVLADGSADPTFGTNGRVVMPCPGNGCSVKSLALDAQQRVVAVGSYGAITGTEMMIMRWLAEPSGVGVPEDGAGAMTVSPLPCTDFLRIAIAGSAPTNARLQLLDPVGRIVIERSVTGQGPWQLDLPASLANGHYTLRLVSASGPQNRKVLVQR